MPNEKQPGTPLPFEEVRNFRDLGGWNAGEGRRVKYGLLYRAPQLDEVRSSADRALLESLGLRVCLDLRSSLERQRRPDPALPGAEMLASSAILDEKGQEINFDPQDVASAHRPDKLEEARAELDLYYCRMPFANPAYRLLFRCLRQEKVPLCFHCSAGKDRTGVAAALILLCLGADRQTVLEDYLLSARWRQPVMEAALQALGPGEQNQAFVSLTLGVVPELLGRSLDAILQVYGDFGRYFRAEYGIDEIERARLRQIYTEPAK